MIKVQEKKINVFKIYLTVLILKWASSASFIQWSWTCPGWPPTKVSLGDGSLVYTNI
jgi:hypothetical protein